MCTESISLEPKPTKSGQDQATVWEGGVEHVADHHVEDDAAPGKMIGRL
jgi:hypothetical protein